MVLRRKYCISFHRMKSGKIHWNTRRCSCQLLEGHSICPFDLHQLVEQCLIHYDDNTNFWLVFWPHVITSTQPCLIIETMCRCRYDKANTNTCHVMRLVRVVLFEDCPATPLLSSAPCRLKSHVLHRSVSKGSILINIHEVSTLILQFISKRLLSEIPPSRKKTSCIAYETCIKDITFGTCTNA